MPSVNLRQARRNSQARSGLCHPFEQRRRAARISPADDSGFHGARQTPIGV